MPLSIFNILDEICENKSELNFDDPEINKAYDIFMLNKLLSSMEFLLPFVSMMNHAGVEKKVHYEFFRSLIPKNNYKFQFMKKTTDIDNEETVQYLCRFFDIGVREAKMYIPLLTKKHVDQLKHIYAYGKNGKNNAADAGIF